MKRYTQLMINKLAPTRLVMVKGVKNQQFKIIGQEDACGVHALNKLRKPKASMRALKVLLAVLPLRPHCRVGDFLANSNLCGMSFVLPDPLNEGEYVAF